MVSFPRRRGNKNAHLVCSNFQMRDSHYWLVKWHPSRGRRGHCDATGAFPRGFKLSLFVSRYSSEELQWVLRVLPQRNKMLLSLLWHRLRGKWTHNWLIKKRTGRWLEMNTKSTANQTPKVLINTARCYLISRTSPFAWKKLRDRGGQGRSPSNEVALEAGWNLFK